MNQEDLKRKYPLGIVSGNDIALMKILFRKSMGTDIPDELACAASDFIRWLSKVEPLPDAPPADPPEDPDKKAE